jgi:predicted enzyme related to lactoylglutathione lyase
VTRLAKSLFDVALNTVDPEAHRAFWQGEINLPFNERLTIGKNAYQDRYDLGDAVLKVCSYPSIPPTTLSGYRELIIARRGAGCREYITPDGGRVSLVEPGMFGVDHIGLRMVVRDRTAHQRFFEVALGFEADASGDVLIGDGRLVLEERSDLPSDSGIVGTSWRCMTIQIYDLAAVHDRASMNGARVAVPPSRFGDLALYSMIRDPDGNWIELSQRASLTGPLPGRSTAKGHDINAFGLVSPKC